MTAVLDAKVEKIALQIPASFDAGAAYWALSRFGQDKFPGVERAKFSVWADSMSPDGRSAKELEEDGILAINCGGGRFDHHPHGKKPGECTFTLVLEALGFKDDPRFRELAEFAVWDDTRAPRSGGKGVPNGVGRAFTLARFFKDLQSEALEISDDDPARVRVLEAALEWLFAALDAYRCKQDRFFTTAAAVFQKATKRTVIGKEGKRYRLVTAETDCNEFPRYARSRYGNQASVVIQKWSTGNTQITTNGRLGLDMSELARAVREDEIRFSRLSVSPAADLTEEGAIDGLPHWYFMPAQSRDGASMLLNGTLRHRDIPPTALHTGRLVNLTTEWLKTQ